MRKLHSLSGVVPVGAFLLLHLWVSLAIVGSRDLYDRQVGFLHGGALLGLLEVVLVLVPLGYHALYGIVRSVQPRDPDHAYDSLLMVTLQRVSGVVILIFVAAHTWEFRVQTWTHGLPVASYSTKLVEHLSSTRAGIPWIALGYLVGLAASFFHLVNGMTSFLATWGGPQSPAARRQARLFFRITGSFFFGLSALLVVQIATGVRYFPSYRAKLTATACGTAVPAPAPLPAASASAVPSALPSAPR